MANRGNRINIFSSNAFYGSGVSYSCQRISEALNLNGAECKVYVPGSGRPVPDHYRFRWFNPLNTDHWRAQKYIRAAQSYAYLNSFKNDGKRNFAYLWPDPPLWMVRRLKARGIPMAREMINCHVATAKTILDQTSAAKGAVCHTITDAHVAYERQVLELVDWVFAPSEFVARSLRENGVPEEKILRAAYGWDPDRVGAPRIREMNDDRPLNFLFVGLICFRKGADTLIRAWMRNHSAHKLYLAGSISREMKSFMQDHKHENLIHLPFRDDIKPIYEMADVLVLPSLEEGAPLVVFEALGAGIPVICTAMASSAIVMDQVNGLIVPSNDEKALADAMERMTSTPSLIQRLSESAIADSKKYTWKVSGAARTEKILQLL